MKISRAFVSAFPNFTTPINLCVILLISTINLSFGFTKTSSPSVFQKFWEIGCEFSGVVSRVRRSAPNPPPEEPNFEDPEELFKYLYPLADVEHGEDDQTETQRSAHGTHSISSWLEDLMELWHSECNQRRMKRSAERRDEYNKRASRQSWSSQTHLIRGRVDRKKPASDLAKRNSSLGSLSQALSSRRGDNYEGSDATNTDSNFELQNEREDNYAYGYADNNEMSYTDEDYKGKKEELFDKEEDKDEVTPAPPPPAAPAPAPDIFFAQYGGDIEYFFPLLSFGIPFDGEITLLGFHGFRGIFPY